MKVMVAYDGSPDAQTALTYGLNKAHEIGGELIVFHILRRTFFLDMDGKLSVTEDAFPRILLVKNDILIHRSGRKILTTFVFANVDSCNEILRYAGETKADLIVIPSRYEELLEKACCLVDVV